MRILQVSSATAWGGGEQHLFELTRGLIQRGHLIELALRPSSPLDRALGREVSKVHFLPLKNSLDLGSVIRLRRIIRSRPTDIVHAHLARDYLICALALRNLKGPRLVLTRHHYLPTRSNWVYRRLLRNASKVIAVSRHVENVLHRTGWPAERVVVIHNWLTPDPTLSVSRDSLRVRWGVSPGLVVGSVGRLTEDKGQQDLIQAAGLIIAQFPTVEFVIAGEDLAPGKPTESRLRRLIGELGLDGRVHLLSRIEPLQDFLAALDIFVLPSRNEAFSLVLIEAMAAGLPVVATEAGGPAEIIETETTGLLVPPRAPQAMATAVIRLLADQGLRERLSQEGRRSVASRFNFDRAIDQIESVYREVLEAGR